MEGEGQKADKSCWSPTALCCQFRSGGRLPGEAGARQTIGAARVRKDSPLPGGLGPSQRPVDPPDGFRGQSVGGGHGDRRKPLQTLPAGTDMEAGPSGTVRSMRLPRRMYPLGKVGPGRDGRQSPVAGEQVPQRPCAAVAGEGEGCGLLAFGQVRKRSQPSGDPRRSGSPSGRPLARSLQRRGRLGSVGPGERS